MRYTQSDIEVRNETTIGDGVILDGARVHFINTAAGRVVGGFVFNQGGSTLVNEQGGIVRPANGSDDYGPVITGSAGNDTVLNYGLVTGLVNLGAGNDRYLTAGLGAFERVDLGAGEDTFEYVGGSYTPVVEGGAGSDLFAATIFNQRSFDGGTVTGFERLSLAGNGQFFNFSGYSSITLGMPAQFGLSLSDSFNPLVDLNLAGNSFRLIRGSLKSITGSDAAERLELDTGAVISGRVSLGGGDDTINFFSFGNQTPPALPAGGIDGGAGKDTLEIQLASGVRQPLDFAKVTGIENISINVNYQSSGSVSLANVTGVTSIYVAGTSSLALVASQLADANVAGALGGTVSLDATTVIGRYGFPANSGFDDRVDLVQGDDRLSTTLVNQGRVTGDIAFYIGDDRYDGSSGSVGGKVYGNAGNDVLIGGTGADWFEGGYGVDTLLGGGGADRLDGGADADRLTGGAGGDVLIGGGGADTFLATRAEIVGDQILDFGAGDRIVLTDATLAGFSYSLANGTLRLGTGETLTLTGFTGRLLAGAAPEGGVVLTAAPGARLQNDFNGDGRSDVFWREAGGAFTDWLGRSDGSFVNNDRAAYRLGVPTDWKMVGTGDFNGDGRSDILWRNDNGNFTNWLGRADGSFVNNDAASFTTFDASWRVAAVDDFNGDGRADVLFRNSDGRGFTFLGASNGALINAYSSTAFGVPTDWQVVGSGDFNGDGRADILWRNNDGRLTNWLGRGDGGFTNNDATTLFAVGTDWKVVGTGDFNGDGRTDILWRNANGGLTDWLGRADGGFTNNDAVAYANVPSAWRVADTGDYNGDGRFDILWRNENGDLTTWLGRADGGFVNNDANAYFTVPTNWQILPEAPVVV